MQDTQSLLSAFETKHSTIRTNSAEEFAAFYETFHGGYSAQICQRGSPERTASLSCTAINQLRIAFARWNFGLRGTLLRDTDHYCVRLPLAGNSRTTDQQSGLTAAAGDIAVFSAREGVETLAAPDNAALNLAVPYALLSSCAMSYYQKELNPNLHFDAHVSLNSMKGAVLKSLVDHVLTFMVITPDGLSNPVAARNLEEYVVTTILSTVPHNYAKADRAATSDIAPRAVKRAEDYMREHAGEAITLAMICDHAGCSLRALQKAFKQFRGKSPMSALRDIRLEQARLDLVRDEASIIQTALKWGFSNPGRFSSLYRQKYGETPSETTRFVTYPLHARTAGLL